MYRTVALLFALFSFVTTAQGNSEGTLQFRGEFCKSRVLALRLARVRLNFGYNLWNENEKLLFATRKAINHGTFMPKCFLGTMTLEKGAHEKWHVEQVVYRPVPGVSAVIEVARIMVPKRCGQSACNQHLPTTMWMVRIRSVAIWEGPLPETLWEDYQKKDL